MERERALDMKPGTTEYRGILSEVRVTAKPLSPRLIRLEVTMPVGGVWRCEISAGWPPQPEGRLYRHLIDNIATLVGSIGKNVVINAYSVNEFYIRVWQKTGEEWLW